MTRRNVLLSGILCSAALSAGCGTRVDGPTVAVDLGQLVDEGNGLKLSEGECPQLSMSWPEYERRVKVALQKLKGG